MTVQQQLEARLERNTYELRKLNAQVTSMRFVSVASQSALRRLRDERADTERALHELSMEMAYDGEAA